MTWDSDASNKPSKKDDTFVAYVPHSLQHDGSLPLPNQEAQQWKPENISRVSPAAPSPTTKAEDQTLVFDRIEQLFKNYRSKSLSASGREGIESALQTNPLTAFRTAHFHRSLDLLEKAAFCYGSSRKARLSVISSLLNELWIKHQVDFVTGKALRRIEESFCEGRIISGSLHIERKGLLDMALRGMAPIEDEYGNSIDAGPQAGRMLRTRASPERRSSSTAERHSFSDLPARDLTEIPPEAISEQNTVTTGTAPRGKVIVFPRRGRRRDEPQSPG